MGTNDQDKVIAKENISLGNDNVNASKQEEICRLTADNGVGIQKVFINPNMFNPELLVAALDREGNGFNTALSSGFLAEYDGLPFLDWHDWFKNYDHSQPFAIIHFTEFRY